MSIYFTHIQVLIHIRSLKREVSKHNEINIALVFAYPVYESIG